MPDPAAPRIKQHHLEIPAQRAKAIEVDDDQYFPVMSDWGEVFWHEGQFDEGHGG